MNRSNKNNAKRFVTILCIAIVINFAFYYLPDKILGFPIKKVDLLSDIRRPSQNDETLFEGIADAERIESDNSWSNNPDYTFKDAEKESITNETMPENEGIEVKICTHADYLTNKNIEDFTIEHDGLGRFFYALDNIDKLGRPVRIAFLGDSFIEGDILVADFRAKMQTQFGGRGIGFIPITSVIAQYRPTIKQSANGWKSYSIMKDKNREYVLSGFQFESTSNDASFQFQNVNMYPRLEEVSSLKFIYEKNQAADMVYKNGDKTFLFKLPPTEIVTQFELVGQFMKGTLQFNNSKGLKAIGVALEDNHGVIVDNFSLRGNSGTVLSRLDSNSCRNLQQIRPYDLIVLQYGLNVANESIKEYSWYSNRMITVIEHIQQCFPGADILVLGVSDRSRNGKSTMPAVMSLLRAQQQMAENAKVAFWSIFAAMGGQNSMVKYTNSNWASKDFTHLNFRGGREIANALYDALLNEKGFYDHSKLWDEKQ